MTKKQATELWNALHEVGKLTTSVKFTYAVAKNIRRLNPEIEAIKSLQEVSREMQNMNTQRLGLIEKYGKKDEKGKVIVMEGSYIFDDYAAFEKELAELKEQNKEVYENETKKQKEFQEFLETQSDVVFHSIDINDLPQGLSADILATLLPIIITDDEI